MLSKSPANILTHILTRVLPLTVLVLLGLWLGVHFIAKRSIMSEINERLELRAQHAAELTRRNIHLPIKVARGLAVNDMLVNGLIDSTNRDSYLPTFFQSLHVPGPDKVILHLLDYKGRILLSNEQVDESLTNIDGLEKVVENGQQHIKLDRNGLTVFVPILYQGLPEGGMYLFYDFEQFSELLHLDSENEVLLLSDKQNQVLYTTDSNVASFGNTVPVMDQSSWLQASNSVPGHPDLTLTVLKPLEKAMKTTQQMNFYLLVAMLLDVLVLILGVVLTTRTVSSSLSIFIRKIKEVTKQHNWNGVVLSDNTPAEIREMQDSFNSLMSELNESTISRDYAESITKSIPDSLIVLHSDQTIKSMNSATCELFGFSEKELLGTQIGKLFIEEINAEEVNMVDKHVLCKDGSRIPVAVSCSTLASEKDEEQGAVWVVHDLREILKVQTDLLESEQRSRLALQSSKSGMWDWNVETGDVFFDERWLEMLEYQEGELDNNVSSWKYIVHPEDLVEVMETLQKHLDGETPVYQTVHRCKTKSGKWKWILDTGEVIFRDENNKPLRAIGTHIDITEQTNLERQSRQNQKMEAIGTLAGGVAHDFNNILQGMASSIELMEMDLPNDSPIHSDLQVLQKLRERAGDLVRQILTFSRYDTEKQVEVEILPILNECLNMLRSTLPKSINIEEQITLSKFKVKGNATQIHQVIVNLCVNAGHAMEKTRGTLTVSLDKVDLRKSIPVVLNPEREYVCLSIKDTGTGMPPDVLSQIFEPFFTTKKQGKGTGLGLSVIDGIIDMHKGHIHVESEVGKGTTFEIFLPLLEEEK